MSDSIAAVGPQPLHGGASGRLGSDGTGTGPGSNSSSPGLGSPSAGVMAGPPGVAGQSTVTNRQQGSSFGGWAEVYRAGDGSTSNGQIDSVDLRSVQNRGDLVEYRSRNTMFGRNSEQTMYVNCTTSRRGQSPGALYATFPDTLGGTELAAVCAYVSSGGNSQPGRK